MGDSALARDISDYASYIAYITTRAMSPNCAPIKVCYYTPLTGWRVTIVYYKLFNNLLYPLTFNFTATPWPRS